MEKEGEVVGRKLFNQMFKDVLITDKTYLLGDDLLAIDLNGKEVWNLEINAIYFLD